MVGDTKEDRGEVSRLRAGIRAWVMRTARNRRHELRGASAPVVLSLLSAAAFGPVLSAAVGVTGAAVVAGINIVSSIGGGVLGEVLASAFDRLRSPGTGSQLSPMVLENEIAWQIREVLAEDNARAFTLRSEIAS